MAFDAALREVAQHTVFTTHTPVPAGHDRFDRNLIEEHLGPLRDELGVSTEQLMGLGRVEPQNEHETFCMTVLGLKLSRRANAVSNLHGHVTRRMWAHLGPGASRKKSPSDTSPTACTSRAGWRGRCSSSTTATSRPTGCTAWASPTYGKASTASIPASCGRRTTP